MTYVGRLPNCLADDPRALRLPPLAREGLATLEMLAIPRGKIFTRPSSLPRGPREAEARREFFDAYVRALWGDDWPVVWGWLSGSGLAVCEGGTIRLPWWPLDTPLDSPEDPE